MQILSRQKVQLRYSRFPHVLHRNFCEQNGEHKKRVVLSPDLEKQYAKNFISKIPKFFNSSDLDNTLKSLFVFKDYLVPNKARDEPFSKLIKKSYFYLFLSKVFLKALRYFHAALFKDRDKLDIAPEQLPKIDSCFFQLRDIQHFINLFRRSQGSRKCESHSNCLVQNFFSSLQQTSRLRLVSLLEFNKQKELKVTFFPSIEFAEEFSSIYF